VKQTTMARKTARKKKVEKVVKKRTRTHLRKLSRRGEHWQKANDEFVNSNEYLELRGRRTVHATLICACSRVSVRLDAFLFIYRNLTNNFCKVVM
jgi:hypothetical protein